MGQSADSPEISAEGTYSFDLRAEGSDEELGISLAGDERIAILVRRVGAGNEADTGLRHGSESANSPNVSYPDAEIDFDNVNHVIYRHENPAAGNDTHSHGTDIRGNLRIFYTVTIDHGSLVGDGNVNAGHIDSESATDGHVLTADGAGGSAWEAASGGGGGSSTFLDLTDTPSAFGTAGQVAAVNTAGDGLIFADAGGGGGGSDPGRIVLADAVGVSNTTGPHEITLTEAMAARQWLSFFVFSSAAASPDGIGYLLSDDVLALTAEATAPTDAENALPVVTASYSASNFSQQSGNYFVYRKDDSTLWIRPTRLAAHTLTITATPMGGGALTTSEQESLSNARVLRSRTFPGEGNGIAVHDSDTEWPTNSPNTFVVTATEYADVERIELLLRQNGKADIPIVITKGLLDGITAGAYMPNSPSNTTRIRGVFHYSRIGPNNRDMNQPVYNPRFDLMEERREASDNCFLIQYGLNGTLLTALYIRARQPAGNLFFQHARMYYWEDA